MQLDQYAAYVFSAYGATALILGGIVLASVLSGRRAKAELEEAEQLEVRR